MRQLNNLMEKEKYLTDPDEKGYTLSDAIAVIKTIPWKKKPYLTQSWGNWAHRMASYCGRIKPAFAHWLIRLFSNEGDIILDPFCGIGTIPLESNFLSRKGIGIDLNPYAYIISLAKMDRRPLSEQLEYLNNLDLSLLKEEHEVADWVKEYYNPETLKEILKLVPKLEKDKRYFILGCLLGISQGHRKGHLSKPSGNIVPYKPKKDQNNEYRPAIQILKDKLIRISKNNFQEYKLTSQIHHADARKLPLLDNSVDVIISSPPYFNTLDYVNVNRLRLEIMGLSEEKRDVLQTDLIQDFKNYLGEMKKCALEMKRVLKSGSKCILILGDLHKGKTVINTAEEIKNMMEPLGFICHAVVEDEIPFGIAVQRKDPKKRLDRILIMTLKK